MGKPSRLFLRIEMFDLFLPVALTSTIAFAFSSTY